MFKHPKSCSQLCKVKHEEGKTQYAFTQIHVAMKPSCKADVPWNTLRGSDSRFAQFKLWYTRLYAQLLRIFKIFSYLFLAELGHSCNT